MHYRNGRVASNGDRIIQLQDGKITHLGILHDAKPGNDYCNGNIAPVHTQDAMACMCDCLHIEDLEAILAEKGLNKRPAGK